MKGKAILHLNIGVFLLKHTQQSCRHTHMIHHTENVKLKIKFMPLEFLSDVTHSYTCVFVCVFKKRTKISLLYNDDVWDCMTLAPSSVVSTSEITINFFFPDYFNLNLTHLMKPHTNHFLIVYNIVSHHLSSTHIRCAYIRFCFAFLL